MDRVAIISDDGLFTRHTTRAVHDAGYTVFTGSWRAHCIDTLKTFGPDLIMLHFSRAAAPEADVAALLEADADLCTVPVLLCSDDPGLYQSSLQASVRAPGAVQASTCQVVEVLVKTQAMLRKPASSTTVA